MYPKGKPISIHVFALAVAVATGVIVAADRGPDSFVGSALRDIELRVASLVRRLSGQPLVAVLRVDEEEFDWGVRLSGETVRHAFKVRNDGLAPLLIERVKGS